MEIYTLSNETIDLLSEKISEMYKDAGCGSKETLRAQLLLEEALIKYQKRFGDGVELYFRSYRIFGQFRFVVRLRTPSFDPFSLEENPMAFMIKSIMSSFESSMPTWKYRNLENEIVFSVRKKAVIGSLAKIVIAVIVSVLLGIIARLALTPETLQTIATDYMDPLSNAYAGLFCVMAVLLIFFGITLTIVHMGDIASVGVLGGKVMWRYAAIGIGIAVVLTLPLLPFFDLSGTGEYNVAAKSIYDILISFIPGNLVAPFLNFNSVHILIIAAMFGFSLLIMGQKGTNMVELFDEGNLVAIYTNNFLNKFIAFYVALKLFCLVTTSSFSVISGAGMMIAVILLGELVIMVGYLIMAKIRSKKSFSELIKILMPPFLITASSANSGAAFSSIFEAIEGCGLSMDTINISLNLGGVFFKPASTMAFIVSSIFMAAEYNVDISIVWVIIAILLSVILAGTMPSVPGAAVSVITILFAQLGIPGEALAVMIAVSALLQFPTTAVDVWALEADTYCIKKDFVE